jgi:anti-sigma regulatory factor (Ser/Thr protein kinase)
MSETTESIIILVNFSPADEAAMKAVAGGLGRTARAGDVVNDREGGFILAAAYDEQELRGHRAAAMEDRRPWCFCVPASNRSLVAVAVFAREGRMLLLPPEEREFKRLLSALAEEAKERGSGNAAFSGIRRLEADFSWKTADFDVSRVCRRIARLLAESNFYADRAEEDECALALEEALVNAVEHGNLQLDSSLRPDDPLKEDLYEAERVRRLADPAYGGRPILISLALSKEEATIVIEDAGEGFDISKVDASPSGLDVSGKGFWLIKRPFDFASYNSKGNVLTLTRRSPSAAPGASAGTSPEATPPATPLAN